MAQIDADMQRYIDELYTRRDLRSGIKLILKAAVELGGFFTVIYALGCLLSVLSVGLSWIGIPLSAGVAHQIFIVAARSYGNASEKDRKAIRAAASWIKGGFSLERFVDADSSAFDGIEKVAKVAEKVDKLIDLEDAPLAPEVRSPAVSLGRGRRSKGAKRPRAADAAAPPAKEGGDRARRARSARRQRA